MMVVPFQVSAAAYSIFVVLEDENIERIKAYDPAEVTTSKMAGFADLHLDTVIVGYASGAEIAELTAITDPRELPAFLRKLSRGFRFRPDRGDYDFKEITDGPQTTGRG